MSEFVYEIAAEAQRFVKGMSEAERASLPFEARQDALAAVGVKTTRTYMEQMRALELLKVQVAEDALAVGQLEQRQRSLVQEMERAQRATNRLEIETLKLNAANRITTAAGNEYVAHARVRASAQEKLAQMGIVTTQQMQQEINTLSVLIRAHHEDALAVQQLAQRKATLERHMEQVNQGLTATAGVGGTAQNIMYNLGQIVEDSQYGWRAVGNNVTFVTQQLAVMSRTLPQGTTLLQGLAQSFTGVGGIVLGVSAAVTLLPRFIDWISKAGDAAEDSRKQFDDAFQSMVGLKDVFDDFEAGGAEAARAIALINLELFEAEDTVERLEALERASLASSDLGADFTARQRQQLEGARERLETLESERAVFRDLLDDHNTRWAVEKRLEELGISRVERNKKDRKETETFLQKEINSTAELRIQVAALAGEGARRLAQQESINRALQERIRLMREMGQAQAGFLRLDPRTGLPINEDRLAADNLLSGINEEGLRTLGNATAEEMARIRDEMGITDDAVSAFSINFRHSVADLSGVISGQLTQAVTGMASTIPQLVEGTASLTQVTRGIIGDFTSQLGQTLIGYGFAGLAIKAFIKNPATAIAAGFGLVALGEAMRHSAQQQVSGFTGSGSFSPYSPPSDAGGAGRDFGRAGQEFGGLSAGIQDMNDTNRMLAGELRAMRRQGITARFDRMEHKRAGRDSAFYDELMSTSV